MKKKRKSKQPIPQKRRTQKAKQNPPKPEPLSDEAILALHPFIKMMLDEVFSELMENAYKVDISKIVENYAWHDVYEYSFLEHLVATIKLFGFKEAIKGAAAVDNPTQHLLGWAENIANDVSGAAFPNNVDKLVIIAVVIALQHSIKSLALYGDSLSSLLLKGATGDDKAFLNAIRVDPSIILCRPVTQRIRRAVIESDKAFLSKLSNAFGCKTGKRTRYAMPARLIVLCLRETGQLQKMSPEKRHELLVMKLRILDSDPDEPATFNRFINRVLKEGSGQ